jgi:hypothetical protein
MTNSMPVAPLRRWSAAGCAAALSVVIIGLAAASVLLYRPVVFPARSSAPAPSRVMLGQVSNRYSLGPMSATSESWDLAGTPGIPSRDSAGCSGISRSWRDSMPTAWVEISLARCGSLESAREVQWVRDKGFPRDFGTIRVPAAVPGAIQGTGGAFEGWPAGQYQVINFRRGVYYVEVAAFVASSRNGNVSALVRLAAREQWRRLPGTPGTGAESFPALVTDGLAANAISALIVIVMVRSVAGAVRNRRRRPASARSSWTGREPGVLPADVTRRARRVSRQARWAVVLWLAAAYCVAAGFGEGSSGTVLGVLLAIAAAAAAGAAALGRRAGAVLRPARRWNVGGGEAVWCLSALALFAAGVLTAILAAGMSSARLAVQDGRLDPTIVMNGALGRWAAVLPLNLAVADSFAITALIWTGAFLCSRRARSQAAAAALLADSDSACRAIYLAGPRNEQLTIRAGLAGRQPLAGQLTFRLFDDFHDVAARLLSSGAPALMASAIPADLRDGRMIVINAAPPVGAEPAWPELADPRVSEYPDRVLLVFPPLSEQEIYARWEVFCARNSCCARLPAIGADAGRLLVLRYMPQAGWLAWHSSRRSEAAYAVALTEALDPRAAAVPQPFAGIRTPAPQPVPAASVPPAHARAAEPSASPPPRAEAPVPVEALPASGNQGDAGTRPGRRPQSRTLWVAAALALLLLAAVNAASVAATTPKAGPVGSAVSQELLPAGALGASFSLALPAGPSAVPVSRLETRGALCAQRSRAWADPARGVRVQIELTGCWPPGVIRTAQEQIDRLARRAGARPASGIPYAAETAGTITVSGGIYQGRRLVFRGGAVLASVELLTRSPPTRSDTSLLLNTARQQLADLPGPPGPGQGRASTLANTRTVTGWYGKGIGFLVLILVLWNWTTRRRMSARSEGPLPRASSQVVVTDVRRRAGRLALLARGRFTLQVVGVYVLAVAAAAHSRFGLVLAGAGAALLAAAVIVRPQGAVRPLPDRLRAGVLTGRRTIRAVSLVVVSLVSAALAIAAPLVGFLFWSLQSRGIAVAYGRIDPGFLGPGLISRAVGAVPLPVLSADCFAIAVAAAVLVPVSYLAARRTAALTADEVGPGQGGRVILYLRNFADDDIRMPTSRLSRNSVVERIAVYRLERFEEVLVRHLSGFAPVIAVNPDGIRKSPIGAARMTISNNEWQARIRDHIASSPLIVVGAAPQRRTDGLGWELTEIEKAGALSRTLLVLPPLPGSALRARWQIFCSMAASYQLPTELSWSADQHLVLASAGNGRWQTWHSRRRTEWNYVVALREAAQAVLGPQQRLSRSRPRLFTWAARDPSPMQGPGPDT